MFWYDGILQIGSFWILIICISLKWDVKKDKSYSSSLDKKVKYVYIIVKCVDGWRSWLMGVLIFMCYSLFDRVMSLGFMEWKNKTCLGWWILDPLRK